MLVQEPAGRVVIVDREPGAGETIVLRRHVEQGKTRPRLHFAQITDPDLGSIGGSRYPREKHGCRKQQAYQGSAPIETPPLQPMEPPFLA